MTETIFILNVNDAIEVARNFRKQGHTLMRVSRGHWCVGDADMAHGKPHSCKIFIDSFSIVPQGEAILYQKPSVSKSIINPYHQEPVAYHRPFVTNFNQISENLIGSITV